MKLISDKNMKVAKGLEFGFLNLILHLAPSTLSGKNVCPNASAGCAKACLNTAGMGLYPKVQAARVAKTLWYFNDRADFMATLVKDVHAGIRKAAKAGLTLAIRLNGTSDIPTLGINTAKMFPDVQFYDYTKNIKTFFRTDLPSNYHLTFSRSETNDADCDTLLAQGYNVAMVFKNVPATYKGYKVVNGDLHDLRFLDEKNVIVGLKAKGKARKDDSGFVIV